MHYCYFDVSFNVLQYIGNVIYSYVVRQERLMIKAAIFDMYGAKEKHIDEYDRVGRNMNKSLLKTTQNTRELGGYRTKDGGITKYNSLLRSDVQFELCAEDIAFLKEKGITTIIDMRGEKDAIRKQSGFEGLKGFEYSNCQIDEGDVPDSVDAVPESYMRIACAANMAEVFKKIANAKQGVMFNCMVGKDRTGVVSAILLCHAGVSDTDIIENYILTKEYARERIYSMRNRFPRLDMNIVIPRNEFMEEFLRLFRERYKSTDHYFRELGLNETEIKKIYKKLVD